MRSKVRFLCVFALLATGLVYAAGGSEDKPGAKKGEVRPISWTSLSRSESGVAQSPARTQKPVASPSSTPEADKEKPAVSPSSDKSGVGRTQNGQPREATRSRNPVAQPSAKPSSEKEKPVVSPSSDNKSVSRPESNPPRETAGSQKPAEKPAPSVKSTPAAKSEPVREPLPVPVPFIQSYRSTPNGGSGSGSQGGGFDPGLNPPNRGGNRGGSGGGGYNGGGDYSHRRGGGNSRGGNGGGYQHWHGWNPGYTWHGGHDQWRHNHYRDHGSWLFLWYRGPVIYVAPSYPAYASRLAYDRVGVYVRQTGDDQLGTQFASALREELSSEGVRLVYSEGDAALVLYLVTMDENPEDPGWGSAVSVSYIWNPGNRFITTQMVDVGPEQLYDLANSVAGYAGQLVDQYR